MNWFSPLVSSLKNLSTAAGWWIEWFTYPMVHLSNLARWSVLELLSVRWDNISADRRQSLLWVTVNVKSKQRKKIFFRLSTFKCETVYICKVTPSNKRKKKSPDEVISYYFIELKKVAEENKGGNGHLAIQSGELAQKRDMKCTTWSHSVIHGIIY